MTDIETTIRTRLDQSFIHYQPSTQLTELKEELVADLTDAVADLQTQGQTTEQAIDTAFEQLGDLEDLLQELAPTPAQDTSSTTPTQPPVSDRLFLLSLNLVNTQRFAVTDLSSLEIDYRDAAIQVRPVAGDELIINEYMNRQNDRFHLTSHQTNDHLTIHQGQRPILWGLHAKIEIFVPATLQGQLSIRSGNGTVDVAELHQSLALTLHSSNGAVRVTNLDVTSLATDTANGTIKIRRATAETVSGSSRSGALKLDHVSGQLTMDTANGSIKGDQLGGGGQFTSSNGTITLDFAQIDQDVQSHSANGRIKLTLPLDFDYQLQLRSANGHLQAPDRLTYSRESAHVINGSTKEDAPVTIAADTANGSIVVTQ